MLFLGSGIWFLLKLPTACISIPKAVPGVKSPLVFSSVNTKLFPPAAQASRPGRCPLSPVAAVLQDELAVAALTLPHARRHRSGLRLLLPPVPSRWRNSSEHSRHQGRDCSLGGLSAPQAKPYQMMKEQKQSQSFLKSPH